MRVPDALDAWAVEHADSLSAETLDELQAIRRGLGQSVVFADRDILSTLEPDSLKADLGLVFETDRADHAAMLLGVVRNWVADLTIKQATAPAPAATAAPAAAAAPTATASLPIAPEDTDQLTTVPPVARVPVAPPPIPEVSTPQDTVAQAPSTTPGIAAHANAGLPLTPSGFGDSPPPGAIASPAFLDSDRIEADEIAGFHGPDSTSRPALLGIGIVALLVLALGAGFWLLRSDDSKAETETSTATPVAPEAAAEPDTAPAGESTAPAAGPTAAPTEAPTEVPVAAPTYWADTTTILNSGSAEIAASTYTVSPSNRAVLTGHTAAITGIAIGNDGRVLTSGADMRLVDWGADVTLASPDVLNVSAPLTQLARTSDERLLAGDSEGNITVISLTDAEQTPLVLSIHASSISSIQQLADGRVAVASVDGDVEVLDIDDPDSAVGLGHPVEVTALDQLSDGRVVTVAVDGLVRLWDLRADPMVPESIRSSESPLTAVQALPDGRLAIADVNGSISITDVEPNSVPDLVLDDHRGAVRALYSSAAGALLSGGDDNVVRVWDLDSGTARLLEGHGDLISAISELPDGRIVTTSADGTGRVWDLTIPGPAPIRPPHEWNISAIEHWSNDQFVTGGSDGLVVLASTSETSAPRRITRHGSPVVGLAILPDGEVVTVDALSNLRITPLTDGAESTLDIEIAAGATALDARPGLMVTGHADGSVRRWEGETETGVVAAHGSGVNDVLALSNGLVVSAGEDRTVRVVDFDDPERVRVFDLHTAPVTVVTELPDGRIASAGTDGIWIWSSDDVGGESFKLTGHRSTIVSIVGLADELLMSTAEDGRVRLWDLSIPENDAVTLVDVPGVVNPHLVRAGSGLYVAGAGRGYVVFTID